MPSRIPDVNVVAAALLLSTILSVRVSAEALDAQAERLVALTHSPNGVCCIARCGDGALAAAVARKSGMLVFAIDERAEKVAQARTAAKQTGLLGTRLIVDAGSLKSIPLTDDYADLLIVADLDDAVLSTVPIAELQRVITPRLGRAIIGRGSWTGGAALTRKALEAWSKDIAGVSIRENEDGLFAIIEKPTKKGADNWSYWNYGPGNNPVSKDTAYGYPESIQWLARPFQTGWSVLYLAAGGRVFLAFTGDRFSGSIGWPRYGPDDAIEVKEKQLHALQGYNGRLLWSRKLPATEWFAFRAYNYSIWVATDEKFYLGEVTDIVTLDAANGNELSRIKAANDGEIILWLAVENGVAYVMTGTHHKEISYAGKRIAAYNLAAKERIWEHQEATLIDAQAIGFSAGRVNFFAGETRAAALDAATGKQVWSNEAIEKPEFKTVTWNPVSSRLLCSEEAVSIMNIQRGLITLNVKDGVELWRHPRGQKVALGSASFAQVDDKLLTNCIPKIRGLDLDSGGKIEPSSYGFSGCGRLISTPGYTIGQLGSVYDLEKKKVMSKQYMKPSCAVGNIVANGIRYSAPHWCRCLLPFRGLLAWGKRAVGAKDVAFPLEVLDAAEPPALESNAADWTQYRRDAAHSGASPAAVGHEKPKECWRYVPDAPFMPTPAIAVNNSVFVGGSDGSVRRIDGKSGACEWDAPTAGKIYYPPTFADNRVFVGSSDGHAYCLSAASGKLHWRFRGAPADKRVLAYDQLISRWPINSNLVVEKGTVFATAGLVDTEGVYVHALDARTGKLKWTNDSLSGTSEKSGLVPVGAMLAANGRLWLRTDLKHPSFDLETGALPKSTSSDTAGGAVDEGPEDGPDAAPAAKTEKETSEGMSPVPPSRERTGMGKDFGLFNGKFLIDAGRRLYSEQCDRVQSRTDAFAQELADDGTPLYPRSMLAQRGLTMSLMPVWDSEMIFMVQGQKISAFPAAALVKAFSETKVMDKGVRAVSQKPPPAKWSLAHSNLNALALSADAVLVAEGVPQDTHPNMSIHKTRFPEWRLIALNRDTGEEIWRVTLPSEPIFDGITIDRTGRIIVACVSGCVVCYGR